MHDSNELYHYGVKGMKWGVRRSVRSTKKDLSTVKKLARQHDKNVERLNKLDKKIIDKQHSVPTSKDRQKHEKMLNKQYQITRKADDLFNKNLWKYQSDTPISKIDKDSATYKKGVKFLNEMFQQHQRIMTNRY